MVHLFDTFELDERKMELRREGQVIHVEPKVFDLLRFLVTQSDRVVTKDEIFDQIWPGLFVTEASLSGAIKQIRKALGDDGQSQRYIKTIRGTGFRFVGTLAAPAQVAQGPAPHDTHDKHHARGQPVLAILPFDTFGQPEADQALNEAIPSELIAALSRLHSVKVISRGSSFRFGGPNVDFADLRRRLGATYVLAGTLEQTHQHLAVVVELVEAETGRIIWSDRYATRTEDVFEMREQIVRAVANAVDLRVPQHEADLLAKAPTENLDAWGFYHLGIRHLYRFKSAENAKAVDFFQQAIARDPEFARAHAGLSYATSEHRNLWFADDSKTPRLDAMDHAERAVDLAPFDAFSNLVLGQATWVMGDLERAIGWLERATELNPSSAFGQYHMGKLSAIACRGDVADQHARAAISLSPLDPNLQSMLSARAVAGFVRDDRNAALEFARKSLAAPNSHTFVCVLAAAIFLHYGEVDAAQAAKSRLLENKMPHSSADFRALFTLHDPTSQKALTAALDRLSL